MLKLVAGGFLTREKDGRNYRLTLSDQGRQAFEASHQVFFDWDKRVLAPLTPEERTQLLALLAKVLDKKARPGPPAEPPATTRPARYHTVPGRVFLQFNPGGTQPPAWAGRR